VRTTLTLDDDVAAMLERFRKARGGSFKDLVNEALREGLKRMTSPPKRRRPFQTGSVNLGRCLAGNVDNVAEVLAVAEDESYK
jgi:hypothetical protein